VAKVRINGESFDFDGSRMPLSEALEIERVLGIRYAQWEDELSQGSMRAMAAFVWKVWHRDGRNVPLQDIVDGTVEVELGELLESLMELAREREREQEQDGGPKDSGTPTTAPARGGSRTTKPSTPASSAST
jgi:hypothetical protein